MSFIQPIQTELHRHLDVSVRTSTLHEWCQARGFISQSTSFEAFRNDVIMKKPLSSLDEVLSTFSLFQKVLDRPENLERLGYEATEDCYLEGTRNVEFRYSPSFLSVHSSLSWSDALSAIERGIARAVKQYKDMRVGLICIATRDFGPDAVAETTSFFLQNRNRFIAMDLAGSESQYPCKLFENAFSEVRKSGSKITIHAGEDAGPESIWEAIEKLGAQRIGHGIRCSDDSNLMSYLRENEICLEVCPTSNWLTGVVPQLKEHPVLSILRAGIPVSINTDDPGVFGTTLLDEFRLCVEIIGFSSADLAICRHSAERFSFL